MKLDPKIVEAAPPMQWHPTDNENEEVARRVLKAASENVPDEVVDAHIRGQRLQKRAAGNWLGLRGLNE